jgi:hypothetical protein
MLITLHVQMCTSTNYATTFIWNLAKPCTPLINFAYLAFSFVWTYTCIFSLNFFKQTKYHTKKINEIEKEYPKFVTCFAHPIDFPHDFKTLIMWFNILLFIYLGFVILTYYINQKVNPNKYPFQNPYMQQYNIYSNLKTKFKLHGIE